MCVYPRNHHHNKDSEHISITVFKRGRRQECPFVPLQFNIILEFLPSVVRQEKERDIQIGIGRSKNIPRQHKCLYRKCQGFIKKSRTGAGVGAQR